ncbi:MAG: SDR family oxidoreductase [Bryobacteraceae bacterium]|jgi:short-subunit dehydrogenase
MTNSLAAITGASSGIGSVFARKLAAQGYDLLLIARRRDRLDQLAAELERAHQIHVEACTADLSVVEEMDRVAARLAAEPRLDLLVNNAGFGVKGRFYEAPLDEQLKMHRLHIGAILRLTHTALAAMVARGRGAIINVASVAGFTRSPGSVSYCASKAWLNAFTEGLYLDLKSARSPVVVQALCPGFTYTEFQDVVGIDPSSIAQSLWMNAEDVVDASLAGLRQRKLFVVPGWRYKMVVALTNRIPERLRLVLESAAPHTRARRPEQGHPS